MSGQNSSISFKVQDTGVSSFIDKIKSQSSQLTAQLIADAQKQTKSAKEQLALVEQRITALTKESRLSAAAAEIGIRQTAQQRVITSQARIAALDEENKRKYRAGEQTSSEYYRKKKRIGQLGEEFSEANILGSSDDKIKEVKEQAKQQTLLAGYMREAVSAIRMGSIAQITAIKQDTVQTVDAVEESEKPQKELAAQLAQEEVKNQKAEKERLNKDSEYYKNNMFSLANGVAIDRVGSMAASMPQAKNELDYIKPMMASMGMLAGGISGNIIDAMEGTEILGNKLGQTNFGQLGAQLGEKVGEFAGASLERTYKSRDELQVSNFKLKALAGGGIGDVQAFGGINAKTGEREGGTGEIRGLNQNLSQFGLSLEQVSRLQYEIAVRQGNSTNLAQDAKNFSAFQQAWGIKDETSLALLEEARANKGSDKDIANIISGIYEKGTKGGVFKDGDRAFLNEFIAKNYLQLQKTLLNTQTSVNSGTIMDILTKFNSVGGQFASKDPRSQALINTIQSSLANPSSDAMKAFAFTTMRRDHPEMGLIDTQIEMQKGLGSPKYFQSVMKRIAGLGGGRDQQITQIASAFNLDNNLAAAKELYEGRQKFGEGFTPDMLKAGSGQFSPNAVENLGEEQTSVYSKSTAEIQNAFIQSAVDGIAVVSSKMTGLFGTMMEGLEAYVRDRVYKSINSDDNGGEIVTKNKTYKFSDYTDF